VFADLGRSRFKGRLTALRVAFTLFGGSFVVVCNWLENDFIGKLDLGGIV